MVETAEMDEVDVAAILLELSAGMVVLVVSAVVAEMVGVLNNLTIAGRRI